MYSAAMATCMLPTYRSKEQIEQVNLCLVGVLEVILDDSDRNGFDLCLSLVFPVRANTSTRRRRSASCSGSRNSRRSCLEERRQRGALRSFVLVQDFLGQVEQSCRCGRRATPTPLLMLCVGRNERCVFRESNARARS